MKHQPQSKIKETNTTIAISVIKNLILKNDIKKAVETCEKNNISAEQFGLIAKYADKDAKEIYALVF
ncbi:MAG: hypothetical protein NC393_07910 [Clostridium sp.]|nr:hypothetical protein [Clostridium sp.]MCM1172038.1 hypothetical protein [Clostridium sp.]MCM1209040.1 hypothetical protein [Ruminococcus sp.]